MTAFYYLTYQLHSFLKKKVETELKDLINILICLEEKTDYDVGGVIVKNTRIWIKATFCN